MRKSTEGRSVNQLSDGIIKDVQLKIFEFEANPKCSELWSQHEVLNIMVVILSKSSYHRTTNEIEILKKATMHNHFFQGLIDKTQGDLLWERCLRKMAYKFVSQGQYLFREGDKGTTFYIILSGRVSIWKRIQVETNQFSEKELVQYSDGQSFGELALENDAPRSASIRAVLPTHLAVLEAEDYMVIKKTYHNQQRQMYYEEFSRLSIFQDWKFLSIKSLFDCVHFVKMGLNHMVYKEGDQSNDVYFIQKGEFKVIKVLKSNNQTQEQQQQQDDLEFLKEQFAFQKPKQNNQDKIEELFQKKKYGSLFTTEKRLVMTLKFLGAGEMFGELEILKSNDLVRQFSVVSTQESNRVYQVSRRDFLRVLYCDKKLSLSLNSLNDTKMKQILQQIRVYERNFIDQTDKKQQFERIMNRDYLNPVTSEEIQSTDTLRGSKSCSHLMAKISSRKKQADNDTKNLILTLDNPEIEFTLSHLNHKSAKHARQKTAEMVIPKPEHQKYKTYKKLQPYGSEKLFGIKLGMMNINLKTSTSIQPLISEQVKKSNTSASQLFFKSNLPLVMQNKYIRMKAKPIY